MTYRLTLVIGAIALFGAVTSQNRIQKSSKNVNESNKTNAEGSAQYRFQYFIKDESTGDYKTQEETRQGNSVRGSYTVAEPNGNLRTVTYTAGEGKGFEAVVDFKPGGSPMGMPTIPRITREGSNAPRGLSAGFQMGMLDPKRYPKPRKPDGNDIGFARVLESNVKLVPGGYLMGISSKPDSDDLRTTVSVDFSMKKNENGEETHKAKKKSLVDFDKDKNVTEITQVPEINTVKINQNVPESQKTSNASEETINETKNVTEKVQQGDAVQKEIKEVFDSMPKMPELTLSDNASHLSFHKDAEEASIDERITQVARQLAESSLRREYEEKKLGHFLPITLRQYIQNREVRPRYVMTKNHLGKSFEFPISPLPLVSRFPPETAQLQLITEVQSVPQQLHKEGFYPMTPAPELSGPLLGGPPLKKNSGKEEEIDESEVDETTTASTEESKAVNSLPEHKNKSEYRKKFVEKSTKPEGKSLKLNDDVISGHYQIPPFLRFVLPSPREYPEYPIYLNIAPQYPIKYSKPLFVTQPMQGYYDQTQPRLNPNL